VEVSLGPQAKKRGQRNDRVSLYKSRVKRHYGKFLIATLSFIGIALSAQELAPTPRYSEQTELSQVEEWVLSQGNVESIAPELAAILGSAVIVFR
jgi:hypothetical protein